MTLSFSVPDRVLLNLTVVNAGAPALPGHGIALKEGRIVAVGPEADIAVLAGAGTVRDDLDGRAVLPGLIDAHNHLLYTGQILSQVQLYDCRSIADIQAKIADAAARQPEGTWILGRGWDESLLTEGRHPNRHDLDAVAPGHPVVIHRVWNRLVANSRALELAGIDRTTPDPSPNVPYSGGFERDADGEPTGLFRDRAKEMVTSAVPEPTVAELVAAIATACREYNRLGITAVSEPGLTPVQMRAFHQAEIEGVLTVRTAMSVAGWGFGASEQDPLIRGRLEEMGVIGGFGSDRLWIDGVKLMPDGGVCDRTARMY
ncbi:MAG: amidohydrolase family protein, partial [Chloroflexota bacterium]|nr:amidohydrolase family protein [Chloroflexota bacterium]